MLSTSSDLSARIFSALDGTLARTLTGHSAAVTDAAIVGIGKHVLTSSNDGTVKLWHVGSSECVKTWRIGMAGAKRKVSHLSWLPTNAAPSSDAHGLAFAANESGHVFLIDVTAPASEGAQQTIGGGLTDAPIGALAVHGTSHTSCLIAIGSVKGIVSIYRYAHASHNPAAEANRAQLLRSFKRNTAEITSIAFSKVDADSVALLVSTSDGLPFSAQINLNDTSVSVTSEFGGYDLDACNSIVSNGQDIFSAGKDGHIRRYQSS